MGYFGKIEDKFKAVELRKKGLSYSEIQRSIKVSKDTLSRWCKDITLTKAQKERLINNKKIGQKKGSLIAAENKHKARLLRIKNIRKSAKIDLGKISSRDKFIAGICLYVAEGDKTDGKGGFANSDPRLIKFMIDWFLTYAKIPMERIRGAIWLHNGLDETKSKIYWSNLTGIPLNQFHKTYIAEDKKNSNKIRKNIHQYGIFSIRFSDSEKHRLVMGWIYALLDGKIATVL